MPADGFNQSSKKDNASYDFIRSVSVMAQEKSVFSEVAEFRRAVRALHVAVDVLIDGCEPGEPAPAVLYSCFDDLDGVYDTVARYYGQLNGCTDVVEARANFQAVTDVSWPDFRADLVVAALLLKAHAREKGGRNGQE